MIFTGVFIFIFGAIVGSFLNVVILRLGTGGSVVKGSSKCLSCGCKLRWYELIPVISFFARKGKCGHCESKISWQYPLVEMTTGLMFLLVFSSAGGLNLSEITGHLLLAIGYWLAVFSILTVIAVYDIRHRVIPNKLVYLFILLSFFAVFFRFNRVGALESSVLLGGLLSALGLFIFFASMWFFSKGRAMGFGDAKLAAGIGLLLGFPNSLVAVTLAFWLGAIVGILLLLFSKLSVHARRGKFVPLFIHRVVLRVLGEKKYNAKSKIPFGPFLALGAIIAFLVGSRVINLYI
ncbi:MAG: prepilin peptidase [bacterium]|nr:prepilin peptidase [bacterium]